MSGPSDDVPEDIGEKFVVKKLIGCRFNKRNKHLEFRTEWMEGGPPTWLSMESFDGGEDAYAIREFERTHPEQFHPAYLEFYNYSTECNIRLLASPDFGAKKEDITVDEEESDSEKRVFEKVEHNLFFESQEFSGRITRGRIQKLTCAYEHKPWPVKKTGDRSRARPDTPSSDSSDDWSASTHKKRKVQKKKKKKTSKKTKKQTFK